MASNWFDAVTAVDGAPSNIRPALQVISNVAIRTVSRIVADPEAAEGTETARLQILILNSSVWKALLANRAQPPNPRNHGSERRRWLRAPFDSYTVGSQPKRSRSESFHSVPGRNHGGVGFAEVVEWEVDLGREAPKGRNLIHRKASLSGHQSGLESGTTTDIPLEPFAVFESIPDALQDHRRGIRGQILVGCLNQPRLVDRMRTKIPDPEEGRIPPLGTYALQVPEGTHHDVQKPPLDARLE